MSILLVAILFAAGGGVWVYSTMMRRTGSNTKNSVIVAGVAAVFAFAFMLILLKMVENSLN